jgi:hypothetical protein
MYHCKHVCIHSFLRCDGGFGGYANYVQIGSSVFNAALLARREFVLGRCCDRLSR